VCGVGVGARGNEERKDESFMKKVYCMGGKYGVRCACTVQ